MWGGKGGPGVSRLPFVSGNTPLIGLLVMAFLFAGPVYDFATRRRVHAAYLWGGLLTLSALPPLVSELSSTALWRGITGFLLR